MVVQLAAALGHALPAPRVTTCPMAIEHHKMSNENCSQHENSGNFYGDVWEASSVQNAHLCLILLCNSTVPYENQKPFFL